MTGPSELAILRDWKATNDRVLAEAHAALDGRTDLPTATSVAMLATIIQTDPVRAAVRWLNLEAEVARLRRLVAGGVG